MEISLITGPGNPLIKRARSLRQKKARLASGLFIVEGIHHVGEAADASWDIESILYAPELLTSSFAKSLIARLEGKTHPVSAQVMESLADKENPQGILAIVRQKRAELKSLQRPLRSVALISPQDPGNVGTILRTMDAAGADTLFVLDGGVELYHPTLVRSSMGTIFWTHVVRVSFDDFLTWARSEKVQLIGSSAHADESYLTLIPKVPWVLMLGNEQKGLTPEQLNVCDVTISLPMQGRVSSLNLAVAAGVLLYSLNKM